MLKIRERTLHNQFKRWEFPSRRPESIHEIPRLLPLVKEMYKKDYTSKEMTTCLREKYGIDVTERQLKSLRLRHQLYLKSGPACRVRHIIPLADIEVPAVESSSESVEGASDAAPRRPRAPAALKLVRYTQTSDSAIILLTFTEQETAQVYARKFTTRTHSSPVFHG